MKEYNFIREVREQPGVVRATLEASDATVLELASETIGKIHRIVLAGCGDSYMLALGAAYALEAWGGILTEAIEAAEFLMYREGAVGPQTLAIVISSSGKSVTVVDAAKRAAQRGAMVAALTNNVPSPLADAASRVLQTQAGRSDAYPTKQTTTALAVLYSLALHLADQNRIAPGENVRALRRELFREIPDRMTAILQLEAEMQALAGRFVNAPMYTFLGCGANLATAQLSAAKMVETSQSNSRATNLEEFSHLYSYTLTEGEPVVLFSRPGPIGERGRLLAPNIRANGGKLIVVGAEGERAAWTELADAYIVVPDHSELFGPLLMTLPLQMFAYYVSMHRGRNPDKPARVGSDYIQQIIYGGMLEGYDKR